MEEGLRREGREEDINEDLRIRVKGSEVELIEKRLSELWRNFLRGNLFLYYIETDEVEEVSQFNFSELDEG